MRRLSVSLAASVLAVAALAAPVLSATGSAADDDKDSVEEHDGPGGPPPWAHSVSGRKHDKSTLESFKSLSPDQREALMTRLGREHREGMRAYQTCRSQGRSDCDKPLPPGLAKRQ